LKIEELPYRALEKMDLLMLGIACMIIGIKMLKRDVDYY
jgi:hypothetical protein